MGMGLVNWMWDSQDRWLSVESHMIGRGHSMWEEAEERVASGIFIFRPWACSDAGRESGEGEKRSRVNDRWSWIPQGMGGDGVWSLSRQRNLEPEGHAWEEWQNARMFTLECASGAFCCVQFVNLGEFCSGDWKFTLSGWRLIYCLVAEQKTCKVFRYCWPCPAHRVKWHTIRCF